jgi:hypothetical protein
MHTLCVRPAPVTSFLEAACQRLVAHMLRDMEACWPFEKGDYLGFGTLSLYLYLGGRVRGFRGAE